MTEIPQACLCTGDPRDCEGDYPDIPAWAAGRTMVTKTARRTQLWLIGGDEVLGYGGDILAGTCSAAEIAAEIARRWNRD